MTKFKRPNFATCVFYNEQYITKSVFESFLERELEGKYIIDKSDLLRFVTYMPVDGILCNWNRDITPGRIDFNYEMMGIKSSIKPIEVKKETVEDIAKEMVSTSDYTTGEATYLDFKERFEKALKEKECLHTKTQIWEPHLAGARKCLSCNMVYNPNRSPRWQLEDSNA